MFEIVRNASIRTKQKEGFSPVDLLQASAKSDITKRQSKFSKGEARMQGLAQQAQDVIGATVPDSGTSQRILATGMLGGMSELASPGAAMESLIPIGLGGMAYSQPMLPITRNLLGKGLQQAGMAAAPVASAMSADQIRQLLAQRLQNQ